VLISDLIEHFGFGPDQGGEWEAPAKETGQPVVLPGWPVLQLFIGELMTTNERALDYLRGRGIEDSITLNWKITCDGERVYVPIHDEEGNLVNYNSRILPGFDGPKYLYKKGAKTRHYILGWKECRDWDELTIVENTFVSLAYRRLLSCTTTFGSSISDMQADKIAESEIRRVAILWDENAELGADRAIKKLADRGVKAAYWMILGQPDDFDINWVAEKCQLVKEAADQGVKWIDFREECRQMRRWTRENGII
jgi:hypothetical protein